MIGLYLILISLALVFISAWLTYQDSKNGDDR